MSTKYFYHCYNHFVFDTIKSTGELIDLAHKNETLEIHFTPEAPDISQIPEKGTKFIDFLKDICIKNGWPQSKFLIVTSNPLQEKVWPSIKFSCRFDDFLSFKQNNKLEYGRRSKTFKKTFGCYICGSSWPRLWISSYLNTHHFAVIDQTFLRSLSNPGHAINLDLDSLMFNFSKAGLIEESNLSMISNFLKKIPIISDKDLRDVNEKHPSSVDDRLEAISNNVLSFYDDIFVDIVCETYFSGKTFRPTEKSSRAFVSYTPFITVGPVNFLNNLKKIGFKTFSKYWSEDYDWLEGAPRLMAISKIIDQIAGWSQTKLESVYQDMSPILEHNYDVYKNLIESKISDNVCAKHFLKESNDEQ